MSTSGSANWTLTGTELINTALRKLRVIDPSQTTDTTTINNCALVLNAMLNGWQIDGIDIWLDQEIVVFMSANAEYYDLGPSGDEACELRDMVKTQLSADIAANETDITVDSITGFANEDNVGVVLANNTIHWDTANGAPANSTITLATGLAGAANEDAYVFGYTSGITRPIEILEARVRDVSDNDEPVAVLQSRNEFFSHTDKTSQGETQEVYYDPLLTNGRLYVWPVCGNDNIDDRLILSCKRRIYDIDDPANDNFDVPDEVLNAVIWNLAAELAPEYGRESAAIYQAAAGYYNLVKRKYKHKERVFLRP